MVEMSENGIPDVFEPVGSGRRGLRGWEDSWRERHSRRSRLRFGERQWEANPRIVVQEGYVLAFYVTFAYIKLYNDPVNGYLYKSAAFPSSIGTGALISGRPTGAGGKLAQVHKTASNQ